MLFLLIATFQIKFETDSSTKMESPTYVPFVALGITLDKYPTLKNVGEIWKVEWAEVELTEEQTSDLPWGIFAGKFHDKGVLVHILPEGSSDTLKEQFTNEGKLIMTLNHDNVVRLHGVGMKGTRNFFIQDFLPKGDLKQYLERNSSLLLLHPSELLSIAGHVLNGMVYLEGSEVIHGELVAENCLVGENGSVKISGFHCSRSPWCTKPLSCEGFVTKIPIPPPEGQLTTSKSDTWAFGLLVYVILTAGQQQITNVDQVIKYGTTANGGDPLDSFQEILPSCLQRVPEARPTFQEIREHIHVPLLDSTPSGSTQSLEGSSGTQNLTDDEVFAESSKQGKLRRRSENVLGRRSTLEWEESIDLWRRPRSFGSSEGNFVDRLTSVELEALKTKAVRKRSENVLGRRSTLEWNETSDLWRGPRSRGSSEGNFTDRLKAAELEALKAKALQKRAEEEKNRILQQIQDAEAKCLKEVEMISKTFLLRLNEANDRATESERARYLADEVKRLTEEKFTLYKYESERTIQDMKGMLEDALLERDELLAALKAVGKDYDVKRDATSRRRTASIQELENKYGRYISTSDKTIESLKEQLYGVVKQRDQLISERESVMAEANEAKAALEESLKEKREMASQLDECHHENERLNEKIATMVHKRQQAERERDQLQLLTDMSLMKLRHAESEKPKKRTSPGATNSVDSFKEIKTKPKPTPDPNLRRLSEHLLDLMPPSRKGNKTMDVGTSSGKDVSFYESGTPEVSKEVQSSPMLLQSYETSIVMSHDSPAVSDNESDSGGSEPSSPQRFIHVNYLQLAGTSGSSVEHSPPESPITVSNPEVSGHDNAQNDAGNEATTPKTSTIPIVHVEEVDKLQNTLGHSELPEIEITFVDENDNSQSRVTDLSEDDNEDFEHAGSFDIGETRLVYDVSGCEEGVPQTCL